MASWTQNDRRARRCARAAGSGGGSLFPYGPVWLPLDRRHRQRRSLARTHPAGRGASARGWKPVRGALPAGNLHRDIFIEWCSLDRSPAIVVLKRAHPRMFLCSTLPLESVHLFRRFMVYHDLMPGLMTLDREQSHIVCDAMLASSIRSIGSLKRLGAMQRKRPRPRQGHQQDDPTIVVGEDAWQRPLREPCPYPLRKAQA